MPFERSKLQAWFADKPPSGYARLLAASSFH